MNANSGEEVIALVKTGIRSQAFRDGRLDSNVANRKGSRGVRLPTQAWRRTLSLGAIATAVVLLLNVAFLVWLRVDREYTNGFLGVSTIYQESHPLLSFCSTDACFSYNSVVFYTTAANEYHAIVVTHDFLTGAPSNLSWLQTGVTGNGIGDYELLSGLAQVRTHVGNMTHLSNEECIKAYGSTELESGYGTVLLVTSAASNDSAISAWNHDPEFRSLYGASYGWLCGYITNEACDVKSLLANPRNWTFS
ncbi:hypothetical protein LTR82_017206 [Friedmanniomyces endolithicus]|uniref:Uncharacterized protein n=1 Tax=Friedmanniomyces endolithicus TaxID=329885 RepID=A0AAN6F7D1_9PEZI|nr:hypothetical protein LTR82_017206 [Friedmanniomyces endolithicus]